LVFPLSAFTPCSIAAFEIEILLPLPVLKPPNPPPPPPTEKEEAAETEAFVVELLLFPLSAFTPCSIAAFEIEILLPLPVLKPPNPPLSLLPSLLPISLPTPLPILLLLLPPLPEGVSSKCIL